jgi:hypothetical protein
MLERWAKTQGEMYVRPTKKKKKTVKGMPASQLLRIFRISDTIAGHNV